MPGLRRPPKIELLWPEIVLKNGHLDGIIQINTSAYFGVRNIYVIVEDARRNHLESGYAMDDELVQNHWGYIPSAPAHTGTTIIVRAIVIDALGGVGIQTEGIAL